MCMGGFKNPALFLRWLIFGLQVRNVPFPSAWNNYIIPVLASLWKPIKNCETGRRPRLSASVILMSQKDLCSRAVKLPITVAATDLAVADDYRKVICLLSLQIPAILVCRCHRGGVSWRSPTIWRGTVMSSSNPRSWSTRSRTRGTTRTCTESCSWTRRGQKTTKTQCALDACSSSQA